MSNFAKIRREVETARRLTAEARRMPRESQGRIDRECEAREHELKAEWLTGRITHEEYTAGCIECIDAKTYHVEPTGPAVDLEPLDWTGVPL